MVVETIVWAWKRFRPREGWLVLTVVVALVACLIGAVQEVNWVPESAVVMATAVPGLLLGILLAKRNISPRFAWTLLTLYGLLVTTSYLANLLPPTAVWRQGWWSAADYWRQNGALFSDRLAGWAIAVIGGNRSQETVGFALGLGLGGWFLAAYTAWVTFRQRRPLIGLTILGFALAVNNYFGLAELWWLAIFVGLAVFLVSLVHYTEMEESWQKASIDYSSEIRLELLLLGGGIAMSLLTLSMTLPAFSLTKLVEAFRSQPAVAEIENTLESAFGGVNQPRQAGRSPGAPGGGGLLPRTYLLGTPPDLQAQVVMTATVEIAGTNGLWQPATASMMRGAHWRALSYNVYTGRGWALSEEREEPFAAGQPIPLPAAAGQTPIRQNVVWQYDNRLIRYTMGLPVSFDHDVVALWRGRDDLSRVQGAPEEYLAVSSLTTASASALRGTAVADVPSAILARYTQLPPDLPERIPALAQKIAGNLPNPYDQALALERFLRQYPYSLDVAPPPPEQDPVDYFLFDLQTGYCDYYASAMAVLARSLGLPARLAVGYLAQPPDETGAQTIRQLDGHSWTEIYFAGYGWVEFEPTAAFASPHEGERPFAAADTRFDEPTFPNTAVPPREPAVVRPSWLIIAARAGVVGLLGLALWVWRRRSQQANKRGLDEVVAVYGRLQEQAKRLDQPAQNSQTPSEFSVSLQERVAKFAQHRRLAHLAARVNLDVLRLTELFNSRRYAHPSPETEQEDDQAAQTWRGLRRPLWLLWAIKKLQTKPRMAKKTMK
ncbi:MAG: hypothetical protein KBE23_03400 [Chloroflexi bacterium]|nr:hypothetical protein [Chloroflexota bacterium]MBP7041759.1 hypothetical protein [Chloroflexota bacterium]